MHTTAPTRRHACIALAGAAAALAGCAASPSGDLGRGLVAEDQVMAMQAAGGGLYEIEAGRLAARVAADPQVRAFGQTLVDHHASAHEQLVVLLRSRGIAPPATLLAFHQLRMQRLAALAGPAFDREFIRTAGIEDHQRQIAQFAQAIRELRDGALRAWFERTLPSLQAHLAAAQAIALRLPA